MQQEAKKESKPAEKRVYRVPTYSTFNYIAPNLGAPTHRPPGNRDTVGRARDTSSDWRLPFNNNDSTFVTMMQNLNILDDRTSEPARRSAASNRTPAENEAQRIIRKLEREHDRKQRIFMHRVYEVLDYEQQMMQRLKQAQEKARSIKTRRMIEAEMEQVKSITTDIKNLASVINTMPQTQRAMLRAEDAKKKAAWDMVVQQFSDCALNIVKAHVRDPEGFLEKGYSLRNNELPFGCECKCGMHPQRKKQNPPNANP